MYVSPNFPTKKALREAIADGKTVRAFEPGLGRAPLNGTVSVEGPHAPKPHSWYARVRLEDGLVVEVVS